MISSPNMYGKPFNFFYGVFSFAVPSSEKSIKKIKIQLIIFVGFLIQKIIWPALNK